MYISDLLTASRINPKCGESPNSCETLRIQNFILGFWGECGLIITYWQ